MSKIDEYNMKYLKRPCMVSSTEAIRRRCEFWLEKLQKSEDEKEVRSLIDEWAKNNPHLIK